MLPNGTVTYVTQSTHPDLFFGLKGGFNNFVGSSILTSPFGLAHCIKGNRDRLHDECIPANGSMGTHGLPMQRSPIADKADADFRVDKSPTVLPISMRSARLFRTSRYVSRTQRLQSSPRMLATQGSRLSHSPSSMMARLHHPVSLTGSRTSLAFRGT